MEGVAGWARQDEQGTEGPGGGTGTPPPHPPPSRCCSHPRPGAATWWDPRAWHRLGWDLPTPQGVTHVSPMAMSPLRQACLSPAPSPVPQHYTTDADGLCTRLIKPKVMEGTVAAQDEFSRSEWPCPFPGSWGPPPAPPHSPFSPAQAAGPST